MPVLGAAGTHPGIGVVGSSGGASASLLRPTTPIPRHCPIPAPHWEQPVGKGRQRRPADIRPSVCEDRLAGAGPVSGPEI